MNVATDLEFFDDVAEVIGYSNAVEHLNTVVATCQVHTDSPDLLGGFTWGESPQSHEFWAAVFDGEVPEGLTHAYDNEEEAKLQPFCVRINDIEDNLSREVVIKTLMGLLRDLEVDYLEYDDEPHHWHCWEFFGVDVNGDAVFWDSAQIYGGTAEELRFAEAVYMLIGLIEGASGEESPTSGYEGFPDFQFKIRNGDDPLVRQWLKDNGMKWASADDLTTTLTHHKFLVCHPDVRMVSHVGNSEDRFVNEEDCPEVEVVVTPVTKVEATWSVVEEFSDETTATSLRIAELEKELARLKAAA